MQLICKFPAAFTLAPFSLRTHFAHSTSSYHPLPLPLPLPLSNAHRILCFCFASAVPCFQPMSLRFFYIISTATSSLLCIAHFTFLLKGNATQGDGEAMQKRPTKRTTSEIKFPTSPRPTSYTAKIVMKFLLYDKVKYFLSAFLACCSWNALRNSRECQRFHLVWETARRIAIIRFREKKCWWDCLKSIKICQKLKAILTDGRVLYLFKQILVKTKHRTYGQKASTGPLYLPPFCRPFYLTVVKMYHKLQPKVFPLHFDFGRVSTLCQGRGPKTFLVPWANICTA